MEKQNSNVIQRAKELLLASPIMKYGITPEKIEEIFANVHMMPTQEALEKEYNPFGKYDGHLEGFNRNHHCYIGPNATPHVIIHELLHELSSQFDKDGHRIANGIAKDTSYSQILLNEGMIDYLASQISGEKVLHYSTEKIAIARLEPMLIKQSGNPDVLFEILFRDRNRINEFIEKFARPEVADKLVNRFQFMNKDNINDSMDEIEKKFNRYHKFEQIKAKISSIFPRINAIIHRKKALPPGRLEVSDVAEKTTIPALTKEEAFRKQNEFKVQNYPTITHETSKEAQHGIEEIEDEIEQN